MGTNPLAKSLLSGAVMQAVMVMVGKLVPAIGAMPNFLAICGTLLAAVTGAIFARSAPGATAGSTATGGAIAGGLTSVVGGLMAVATGQWPGFEIVQLLFPAISGAVGGSVGGLLGRMMNKPASR